MTIDVYDDLTRAETLFNMAGCVPVASIVSGLLRCAAAKIQFIAGLVLGVAGMIGQMAGSNAAKWEDVFHHGYEHIKHGCLNFTRGLTEAVLGATVIGSIGLFIALSAANPRNIFAPIFAYRVAQVRPLPN